MSAADLEHPHTPLIARRWPWLLAGALVYLSFGYTEMMGSDLWWHLAAGREIIQTRTLWLVDDWSYTELASPWHNHEWLADLVFYAWASLMGVSSLVYWKWLLIIATFAALQNVLSRVSGNAAAALAASAVAVAIAAPFLDMRPQLYTLLGVAVLLNLSLLRRPPLLLLLGLFLVWANLHGGFVFGLMLLGILLFPWRDIRLPALRDAALRWGCCAAVCLLNPDGINIFTLPVEYALNADSPYRGLAEWRSPFESGGIRSSLYLYTLVIAAALALSWLLPSLRRRVPFLPEALVFALLSAAMSATSRRFIILWAMGFALLLAPFAAALLRQRFVRPLLWPLLFTAFIWGAVRLAPYPLRADVAFHYLTAEYVYPHGLADFVELNDLQGKTFAYYNWGGYLHWRGDGQLKVFLDGRANTLFDDATYLDYLAVLGGRAGWIERVEQSGAQLFLWPRSSGGERLLQGLLQTRRWRLLHEDARGSLLAHESFALPPTLRHPKHTLASDLSSVVAALRRNDVQAALTAASRAHDRRPWDHDACSWLRRSLQLANRKAEADAVIADCRQWFPSRYLR
jgi:hypothetical protein